MSIRSLSGALGLLCLLTACSRVAPLAAPKAAATAKDAALATALSTGQPIATSLVTSFDTNHDGTLEPTELTGTWLADDLKTLDADHDGKLSEGELESYFENTGEETQGAGLMAEGFTLGAGGGIAAGVLALGFAGYFTYTGIKGSHDFMYPEKETLKADPSTYGWAFDTVPFTSHDGLKLVGWYIPAATPTTKGIVVFHGYGSDKDVMIKTYGAFLHDHYNLFVYDQRYCGESQGDYTTIGCLESADAPMAFDQLRARGNTSIGAMGESMGAAVAINLAAHQPAVKAVWEDCAFDTMYDAVEPRAHNRGYPLPGPVADSVIAGVNTRTHLDVTTTDPIKWIAAIAPRPVYVVHGQLDGDTTPINGEKLFNAAAEPKTMWRTPLAHHAESAALYPAEYRTRINAFFDAAL